MFSPYLYGLKDFQNDDLSREFGSPSVMTQNILTAFVSTGKSSFFQFKRAYIFKKTNLVIIFRKLPGSQFATLAAIK